MANENEPTNLSEAQEPVADNNLALEIMGRENEKYELDKQKEQTNQQNARTDLNNGVPSNIPQGNVASTFSPNDMLSIFANIDRMMGELLKNLAQIDESLRAGAQIFFKEANTLSQKKNLSDEDSYAILANVAIGGAISGISKAWAIFQKEKALIQIKQILKQEAEAKLQSIINLEISTRQCLQICKERFLDDAHSLMAKPSINIDIYRTALYHEMLLDFLKNTYESALIDEFYDSPYPTLDIINRYILYVDLNNREDLLDENSKNERSEFISELLKGVKNSIGLQNPKGTYRLLANDSQLFAIACYDLYPLVYESAEQVNWEDSDELILSSETYYESIAEIEQKRLELNNVTTPIMIGLNNNESYHKVLNTLNEFQQTRDDNDSRIGTQALIWILFSLLGFLGCWEIWDLKWYWCVIAAIVVAVLCYFVLPISKGLEAATSKITRIEKSLQTDLLERGGYKKTINLSAIENKSHNGCLLAILFGVIGLIAGPLGCVAGIIIGLIAGGDSSEIPEDYSYEHIRVKPSKKSTAMVIILAIVDCYLLIRMIF